MVKRRSDVFVNTPSWVGQASGNKYPRVKGKVDRRVYGSRAAYQASGAQRAASNKGLYKIAQLRSQGVKFRKRGQEYVMRKCRSEVQHVLKNMNKQKFPTAASVKKYINHYMGRRSDFGYTQARGVTAGYRAKHPSYTNPNNITIPRMSRNIEVPVWSWDEDMPMDTPPPSSTGKYTKKSVTS